MFPGFHKNTAVFDEMACWSVCLHHIDGRGVFCRSYISQRSSSKPHDTGHIWNEVVVVLKNILWKFFF